MEAIALEAAQSDDLSVEPAQSGEHRPQGKQFTAENARIMALRSHELRRQRAEQERIAAEAPKPVEPQAQQTADYVKERITRTRERIVELEEKLEGESDAREIKSLCEAIAKLSEVERILDNRPLPGSNRPSSIKPTKRGPIAPLETPD